MLLVAILAALGRQRRQFLPASRIGSFSLKRPVSKECGGDALRLQAADFVSLSVMKVLKFRGGGVNPPYHPATTRACPNPPFSVLYLFASNDPG